MRYCPHCGEEINADFSFCPVCGKALNGSSEGAKRTIEYEGKLYKCPNCGEVLKSYMRNCPSCGIELRDTNRSKAILEFTNKLEDIEKNRGYDNHKKLFDSDELTNTDKKKINLIQSFSVPNNREDMLDFMILASTNINMSVIDGTIEFPSKSELAINDAWLSKMKQVYYKAKNSSGKPEVLIQIQTLYDDTISQMHQASKQKKGKNRKEWIFAILFFVLSFALLVVSMHLGGR